MRKIALGLIVAMMLLPVASFAQTNAQTQLPTPPASWVTFMKAQKAKRTAFFKELKAEMDDFLSAHPDAQAYLKVLRAAHPPKLHVTPTATKT